MLKTNILRKLKKKQDNDQDQDRKKNIHDLFLQPQIIPQIRKKPNYVDSSLVFSGEDWERIIDADPIIYGLNRKQSTAVLKLTSFAPDYDWDDIYENWVGNITDTLQDMKDNNVENLIVDVMGNGGGWVALGYLTLIQLVEGLQDDIRSLYGLYDFRVDTTGKMGEVFDSLGDYMGDYTEFLDPETLEHYTTAEFYTKGEIHQRGGELGHYSKKFYQDFLAEFGITPEEVPKSPIYFPPERLMILTDGTCGSTCAAFVKHMQESGFAKVAGVGGLHYQTMDTSSFAGGYIADIDYFNEMFAFAGLDSIPPFPTRTSFSMNWAELYSFRQLYEPGQFANLPADFKIDWWDFHKDEALIDLYNLALNHLPKV